ncbi:hypothetical protein TrLO_g175 [Triparma laevis f. longispina]|uniref:Multidrug and toxic compound extrusion protein n=1 Tax=Triparma laevis f. longispina TaxID=1714387 RepID=A0A9W6ZLX9_9STRA|nr:hypothetical protein TrLO_g175 [Triparma laevis f. longispina]
MSDVTFTGLLRQSILAIANEASPYLSIIATTALLSHHAHGAATDTTAAFSGVQSSTSFATGLFNFLIAVVMNHVGNAVGAKAWGEVLPRVRFAVTSTVVVGAVCCGVLLLLEDAILVNLLELDSDVLDSGARVYYKWRALTVPAQLLLKVATGVLAGMQMLRAFSFLNIGVAILETSSIAAALALRGGGGDNTLNTAGFVFLIVNYAGAVIGLILVRVSLLKVGEDEEVLLDPLVLGNKTVKKFSPIEFLRNSRDMLIRSLFLQSSVWSMSILASRLGSDILAAHHVALLLWMTTSYIIDGFADLGTMIGSKLLGEGDKEGFAKLTMLLIKMSLFTGVLCSAGIAIFKDQLIDILLANPTMESKEALNGLWPLLSLAQISNSLVFVYDGLMSANSEFRFSRGSLGCKGGFESMEGGDEYVEDSLGHFG